MNTALIIDELKWTAREVGHRLHIGVITTPNGLTIKLETDPSMVLTDDEFDITLPVTISKFDGRTFVTSDTVDLVREIDGSEFDIYELHHLIGAVTRQLHRSHDWDTILTMLSVSERGKGILDTLELDRP